MLGEKSGKILGPRPVFAIQTELLYRIRPEKHWHKRLTLSISQTEILFQEPEELKIGTIIDILYSLQTAPARAARVRCQGEVLRISDGVVTAKVAHCRLIRG